MGVFLDSNILLKYLSGDRLAQRIVEENKGYVNTVVVSEVVYGYIRAVTGLSPFDLKKKFDKVDVDLEPVKILLENFVEVPVPPFRSVLSIIDRYRLLPNDAAIVASMQAAGLDTLATFDSDFVRVDWIKLVPKAYWLKQNIE